MKIYRVQDAEGRGPWRPGFSQAWIEERPDAELDKLFAIQDEFPNLGSMLRRSDKHVGVGCKSLSQLRMWFTEKEYQNLLALGFECCALEVDRVVAESEIQCVFARSKPLNKNARKVRLYR